MTANSDAAAAFAAQCAADGDPRADIVAALQSLFGVSRATAYRLTAAAMAAGGCQAEAESIARLPGGSIDIAAEAERQYAAAVARDDESAQLRWFAILRKLKI
jgi:hypothetical protein